MIMKCNFREVTNLNDWSFGPTPTGKMKAPKYGAGRNGVAPAGKRAIKRCPKCNKRLRLRAIYCVGGEFSGWVIPAHSVRESKNPGPKRKSTVAGRGK